jgi:uncharacterized glyoxalase superfamily protein PhnB
MARGLPGQNTISGLRHTWAVRPVSQIASAVAAGGEVVKEAAGAQWGGYYGYFCDPDGYLWKVATSA